MRYLANHMLMTTVAMVRVIQTGMNKSGKLVPVLSPVAPLEKSAGRNVSAAKPSITAVTMTSRRDEDLFAPAPCGAS